MNHHILTFVVILKVVSCQETTTEGNHHTVTYNPGQDCLPYDGSVVPDCRKYVDPITKQPYFKEHSASKFTKIREIYRKESGLICF